MRLCLEYHGSQTVYDGSELAKEYNMLYYETSALTGYNIEKAMKDIMLRIVDHDYVSFNYDMQQVDNDVNILNASNQMSNAYKSGCGC